MEKVEGEDSESIMALEKYTRDLTKDAEDGKIDPIIGRDEEEINGHCKYFLEEPRTILF